MTDRRTQFVSTILFCFGCINIIRGIMHTFAINYSATKFAGINMNTNELFLLALFGISNFIIGIFEIYIALYAKEHALTIMIIILFFFIFTKIVLTNVVDTKKVTLKLVGRQFIEIYAIVCIVTIIIALCIK